MKTLFYSDVNNNNKNKERGKKKKKGFLRQLLRFSSPLSTALVHLHRMQYIRQAETLCVRGPLTKVVLLTIRGREEGANKSERVYGA